MEKVVQITWDESQIKEWYLSEENIKLALNNYFENKSFDVEELIEVDEDEVEEQYVNVNIEEIKNDLANKEQQLSDLEKFIEINDGYQFGYLEHEIDNLKMEIENIKDYLNEVEGEACECPFCKIDELEAENEGLCDENVYLCLQLKEKDLEIEKLKRENESLLLSTSILRNALKMATQTMYLH
jgi:hypothetical protein